jgi:hypothetical protein
VLDVLLLSSTSSIASGFIPGTSPLEPFLQPTTLGSSFRLLHFPYYLLCPGTDVFIDNILNVFLVYFRNFFSLSVRTVMLINISMTKHFIFRICWNFVRFLHFNLFLAHSFILFIILSYACWLETLSSVSFHPVCCVIIYATVTCCTHFVLCK